MRDRIRIGVVGAGLIAQWEHIPNLLRLSDRFVLVGRGRAVGQRARLRRRGISASQTFPDSDALLGEPLDAVLIASPDFTHVTRR